MKILTRKTVQLEEEEEEEEEEQKQFLAKLLDAFAKQNSALYDAKMKAFSSLPATRSSHPRILCNACRGSRRANRGAGASFDAPAGLVYFLSSSQTKRIQTGTVLKTG